jgi:hypothetical protein
MPPDAAAPDGVVASFHAVGDALDRLLVHSPGAPMSRIAVLLSLAVALCPAAVAQTDYERWVELRNPFESTSGGGVMIDGYDPVVGERDGRATCTTEYSVRVPGQPVAYGSVVFEARPVQGGTLCTNGRFRMRDSGTTGTTPFEVFIKDGIKRRSP